MTLPKKCGNVDFHTPTMRTKHGHAHALTQVPCICSNCCKLSMGSQESQRSRLVKTTSSASSSASAGTCLPSEACDMSPMHVQVISLLSFLVETEGALQPSIVVVPSSVLPSWQQEFMKWAPTLKVFSYCGKQEERAAAFQSQASACICGNCQKLGDMRWGHIPRKAGCLVVTVSFMVRLLPVA